MHMLNIVTLLLLIIGGINWGIFALAGIDLVGGLFGSESGVSKMIFLLVGASAIWQLIPLFRSMNSNEVAAQHDLR